MDFASTVASPSSLLTPMGRMLHDLVSAEHDLAHEGFPSTFQQNFHGLLVCNARKREHSRKMAINFPSDGRLGPFFWNENDKNYVMGGKFS